MSNTSWTPGAWAAIKSKSVLGNIVFYIAQEQGAPYTPNYSDVAQTHEGDPEEVQEANANLIAAAPELYEALADLVSAFDGEPGFGPAKKALAKARGEL